MSVSLKSTVLAIAAARDARMSATNARNKNVQDILSDTARIRKENQDNQQELSNALRMQANELRQSLAHERNVLTNLVKEMRNGFQNERRTLIQSLEASKGELKNKLKYDTEIRLTDQESLMNHIHTFMDANRNEIEVQRQLIQSRLETYQTERKEGIELWKSMLGSRIHRTPKESDKTSKAASQFAIQIPFAPSQQKHSRKQ